MTHVIKRFTWTSMLLLLCSMAPMSNPVHACGGFFCTTVPIDQAGEQIIFRKDGDTITAIVRILYEGNPEDFSWVVPVPDTPELSTGSDATFDELDRITRPVFNLTTIGQSCTPVFASLGSLDGGFAEAATAADSSVVVEQELVVGPYEIQVISGTDASEMISWLTERNYDLSDRGEELITPYVEDGMKFVALRLSANQTSGSIQPLIMKYKSDKPMVPIRLTAVAAQEDMGVVTWIVGDARAVPENYLHVIPNYTKLNWYTGSFNAYVSYQTLITDAMDEAGGQGFATDFAARINTDLTAQLTQESFYTGQLISIAEIDNDADALVRLFNIGLSDAYRDRFRALLPAPSGQDDRIYQNTQALQVQFSADELNTARAAVLQALTEIEIDPLRNTLEHIPEGAYMTRLYTTLSADEMTLDPVFDFNANMADQGLTRQATLNQSCTDGGTKWSLTLGPGTGRDGEVVINSETEVPFSVPIALDDQPSVFLTQRTSGSTMPEIQTENRFDVASIDSSGNLVAAAPVDNDTNGNETDVTNTMLAMNDRGSGGFLGGFSILSILLGGIFFLERTTRRQRDAGQ